MELVGTCLDFIEELELAGKLEAGLGGVLFPSCIFSRGARVGEDGEGAWTGIDPWFMFCGIDDTGNVCCRAGGGIDSGRDLPPGPGVGVGKGLRPSGGWGEGGAKPEWAGLGGEKLPVDRVVTRADCGAPYCDNREPGAPAEAGGAGYPICCC